CCCRRRPAQVVDGSPALTASAKQTRSREEIMKSAFAFAALAARAFTIGVPQAFAQSGGVEKAVGGYNFEDAAKEAAGTKDFHSADGHLTFAIVTHTAANALF